MKDRQSISESVVKKAALTRLESLGYAVLSKSIFDGGYAQDDKNPFG